MVLKSALKSAIDRVLEEHDLTDKQLSDDLTDSIAQEIGEEFYDDEDEDSEEA